MREIKRLAKSIKTKYVKSYGCDNEFQFAERFWCLVQLVARHRNKLISKWAISMCVREATDLNGL